MLYFVYFEIHEILFYISLIAYLMQTISHLITACVNPGIPSRDSYVNNYVKEKAERKINKENGYSLCKVCNIIVHKAKDVAHCEDCNVCVESI